jgi:hypothetical protein
VFTARYGLSAYIKQMRFLRKGLNTSFCLESPRKLNPLNYAAQGAACTQAVDAVRRQKQFVSRACLSSCVTLNMRHSKNPKAGSLHCLINGFNLMNVM